MINVCLSLGAALFSTFHPLRPSRPALRAHPPPLRPPAPPEEPSSNAKRRSRQGAIHRAAPAPGEEVALTDAVTDPSVWFRLVPCHDSMGREVSNDCEDRNLPNWERRAVGFFKLCFHGERI